MREALIVCLFIVAFVIEAAIIYQIPWQVIGSEFVRTLGQLFISAPQSVEVNELTDSRVVAK